MKGFNPKLTAKFIFTILIITINWKSIYNNRDFVEKWVFNDSHLKNTIYNYNTRKKYKSFFTRLF
jgi:hypothetical protein